MKPGQTVYLGFSTDFLIREADPWRGECWDMIRERRDLNFIFLTKRIERFMGRQGAGRHHAQRRFPVPAVPFPGLRAGRQVQVLPLLRV